MLIITYSTHSYPLTVSSNLANLTPSQIDHLCSYISQLTPQEQHTSESKTIKSDSMDKRFVVPFPDMSRFLSTSHKLHHHEPTIKSGIETSSAQKHDFHAYLCSITQNPEQVSNFLSIFIEEHGEPPAFNIFESCEEVSKRDLSESKTNHLSSAIRLNEISEFCSNRPQLRFTKRWKHSVEGPISIDFIHQMLESRKVKSYPYPAEMDPYLV
ncbi:unnamed protein product [Adineta steineri]|uniref:Uncharacterized protein n=1 Tax=Adineta steineri TaxID=433720 RepID=A0A813YWD6_9BILA|nr:unnamed protein product [Adineta steineri]CAF0890547.1 unnamed protein product [Adineta steineri]